MKKIYSIGLHKTGSSSLQNFLLQNQLALLKSGVLFPPVTPEGTSRLLAEAVGQRDLHRPARLNEYMAHNALAYRLISEHDPNFVFPDAHNPMPPSEIALAMVHDLTEQLDVDALVFCSEDLARASFHSPDSPKIFSNRFGTEDTTILCTIRRPDEAISSWQCQRLNFPNPFPRLQDAGLEGYLESVHLNYDKALQPWVSRFGGDRLALSSYQETQMAGGAVEHFWKGSGLSRPDGLFDPEDQNKSVPYAVFEIARLAKETCKTAPWQVLGYLQTVKDRLLLPDNQDVDLIGNENRKLIARQFRQIHTRLSDMARTTLFSDDLNQIISQHRQDSLAVARNILPQLQEDALENCENKAAREWVLSLTAQDFSQNER
ncbi:hypothetical protein [Cognatishimia sp.]|uniref:hypothetical protein n=1 Tax=Cognatishimia sp. TaxID=2211648 RepID=UPI0035131AF3